MSSSCRCGEHRRRHDRHDGHDRHDRSDGRRVVAALPVALVGLVLSLGACSIGAQAEPDRVAAPGESTTAPGSATGVPLNIQVYLVRGDRLQRVTRTTAPGRGLEPALRALTAPLGPEEVAAGLHTAVPVTTRTPSATLSGDGTARVAVPAGFDRLSMSVQQEAMAQIVFTVTADTLADQVQLVSDGRVVAVPDAHGELVTHPVSRQDYADLAPSG